MVPPSFGLTPLEQLFACLLSALPDDDTEDDEERDEEEGPFLAVWEADEEGGGGSGCGGSSAAAAGFTGDEKQVGWLLVGWLNCGWLGELVGWLVVGWVMLHVFVLTPTTPRTKSKLHLLPLIPPMLRLTKCVLSSWLAVSFPCLRECKHTSRWPCAICWTLTSHT